MLEENGFSISKKEINSWLVSLQEVGLISKNDERGKPVALKYENRYTFDLWKLTKTGLIIGERLPRLMAKQSLSLPSLIDLTPSMIHESEYLYFTTKLLILLYDRGNQLSYRTVRNELAINREKLAVYSWPDSTYSDKPLFEITIKPPSLKSKIFKLFGWVIEQDLTFKLTKEGKTIAETIISKEKVSDR